MPDIVGLAVGRIGTAIARGQVLQELNRRSGCRPQPRNTQAGAKDIVQPLLLDTVIFALAGDFHPQGIAIKGKTSLRICHHDGGVVNSQKERVFSLPPGVAFSRRKPQNLQVMVIRVAEIKGFDAGGGLVPFGNRLRAGGRVTHPVLTQVLVGPVHITDNNGNVLKPAVVAAGVQRDGASPLGSEIFGQQEYLPAQLQSDHSHAQSEKPLQVLIFRTMDFDLRHFFKAQDLFVKRHAALQVGHGYFNSAHRLNELLGPGRVRCAGPQKDDDAH